MHLARCHIPRGVTTVRACSVRGGQMRPTPVDDGHSVAAAVKALHGNEVVAVPTDTLYGLAASANSALGIQRLYQIKGRDAKVPLAVCVADAKVWRAACCVQEASDAAGTKDVARYARTQHLPRGFLEQLLPGPVTLVLDRLPATLSDSLNPGVLRIGIRVPDRPFIRSVAREFGGALALTSANLSGTPSSLTVDEFRHLWPQCACVFDGGQMPPDRRGSTVVDLSQEGTYCIIREGSALALVADAATRAGLRQRTE